MPDAKLNLDVDASGVVRGAAALNAFQQSAQGANAESKRTQDSFSGLTREMTNMVAQQREMAQLMQQVAANTHATNTALAEHRSTLSGLAQGVTAVSTAYLALSEHSRAAGDAVRSVASDQTVGNIGKMTASLEALNVQMRQASQWNLPTSLGQALTSPTAPAAALFTYNPQFQQLSDQIARLTTAMSLRTNTETGTLLQAISSAGRVGVSGDQGTQLASRISQILQGYTPEAEAARRTLQSYGVDTNGNANQVLTQALQALSARPPSQFRNAAAEQIFGPGFDVSTLLQSNVEKLTPQGAEGRYQLQQQGIAERIQGQLNTLIEEQNRLLNDPNRKLFGSDVNPRGLSPANPLSLIPGSSAAYRYFEDLGQYNDPSSVFALTQRALSQQQSNNFTQFNSNPDNLGFFSNVGRYVRNASSTGQQQIRNYLNPLLGNVFGTQELPGVPQQPGASGATPVPQDLLQRFYEVLISAGRTSPEALQSRITVERQKGEDIVKQVTGLDPEMGKKFSKEFEEAMTVLTRRMQQLADPVGTLVEKITQENTVLALPLNQQAQARFVQEQNQAYYERFGHNLAPGQLAQLGQTFTTRGNLQATNSDRQVQDEIKYQDDLAAAYTKGDAAVQQVTAAHKEYEAALKTGADAAHQAANAQNDVTLAEKTAFTEFQKMVQTMNQQTAASARLGAAGAGGPVAVKQAEIENEIQSKFYDAQGNLKPGATLDQVAQARRDLQSQLQSKAQQSIGTSTFQYNQTMGTMSNVLGGGGAPPGVTMTGPSSAASVNPAALAGEWWGATAANPQLRQYVQQATQLDPETANWCAAFANAVLATSGHAPLSGAGKNIATSFANYGGAESAGQAQAGDLMVMMRGLQPGQTGGHVGFFTGQTQNGRYQMVSGNHGDAVGYSYVDPSEVMFRSIGAGGAPLVGSGAVAAGGGGLSGASAIQQAQARAQAQTYFQGLGINPSQQQLDERTTQILNENFAKLATSTAEQVQAQQQLQQLERQRAAAEAQGPQAVQALDDQIKIVTETQKLLNTSTGDTSGAMAKLTAQVTANVTAQREATNQAAFAQITRQQTLGIQNTRAQISAFESGGLSNMQLTAAAQPIAQQYINAGMDPQQAQQLAQQLAAAAKAADDTKTALVDASQEISTTMKSAIGDLVDGLTNGIGKAHGLRLSMEQAALSISKLGLNMFLTKPLETLADNVSSGRGFNFNVGNSGMSYTDALGKAFMGGIGKLFGGGGSGRGGGDSSTSGGFLASLFGGNSDSGSGGSSGNGGDSSQTHGAGMTQGSGNNGSFLAGLFGKTSMLGKLFGGDSTSNAGSTQSGPGDYGGSAYGDDYTAPAGAPDGFTDYGDGTYGGGGDVSAFHAGGYVGAYGYGAPRSVAPWVFYGAPRFHEGGLAADEVPIIARKGERVLTEDQNANYTAMQSRMGSSDVHVTNNIYTQDAHSFRANSDQIAIGTLASFQRGQRNT